MANELVHKLLAWTVAISVAIVVVLLLRRPLRRLLGAGLAYPVWLLVPALMGGVLAPPMAVVRHVPKVLVVLGNPVNAAPRPMVRATLHWNGVLLGAWIAGAVLLALWFCVAHRRFVRGLGKLKRVNGLYYSTSTDAGPALLGLWRPKLVVPADFAARYDPQEQALIVEHECVHARRADLLVNLVQAALQCLFWFNPLVHVAAVFFRADQEMACDAAVLRRHPNQRRTYAEALLKSHTFSTASPITVACSWRLNHPLKERFMSLQQNLPGQGRRTFGRLLLAGLLGAGCYAGMAARADEAMGGKYYDILIDMQQGDGGPTTISAEQMVSRVGGKSPHIIAKPGEKFSLAKDGLRAEFVITPVSASDRTVKLAAEVTGLDGVVSHPVLMARLGEKVGISVGSPSGRFDMALVVSETDKPLPTAR